MKFLNSYASGGDKKDMSYYAPAPRVGAIKRRSASDVCLSRTSGLSREPIGLGRLKLAQR